MVSVTVTEMMLDWRLKVTVVVDGSSVTGNVTVMGVTTVGDGERAVGRYDQMVIGWGVDLSDGVMGDRRLMHAHDDL